MFKRTKTRKMIPTALTKYESKPCFFGQSSGWELPSRTLSWEAFLPDSQIFSKCDCQKNTVNAISKSEQFFISEKEKIKKTIKCFLEQNQEIEPFLYLWKWKIKNHFRRFF